MADLSHLDPAPGPALPAEPRGRIPLDFIRSLRERADIVAVVDRHVKMRKQGKDYAARCPFHAEDSPSFTVSPGKAFYHCFGCGAHGDAIDFLQRHLGLPFADAVRQLAAEMGVPVPTEPGTRPARPVHKTVALDRPAEDRDEPIPLPDDLAAFLCGAQGRLDDERAVRYLQARHIPLELARAHGLGFAPQGFRGLPGGMAHDGPRIVAPHTRPDGVVVGLYGRRIDQCDKGLRHRNLGEQKGGIFNAPALALRGGPLWLCEGVFDALSLAAIGIERPVAIFGLGRMRWSWLAPSQRELVLAVDTDAAGEKAVAGFLREAAMRGLAVSRLTADEMGGRKDINEALVAGALRIEGMQTSIPHEVMRSGEETKPGEFAAPPVVQAYADPSSAWWRQLASVTDEAPEGLSAAKWLAFAPLCRRFAFEHGEQAAALGWTLDELVSLPTMGTGADAGALWDVACAGANELAVFDDRIEIRAHTGSKLTVRRAYLRPSGVLPWAPPWVRDSA
jgi:hypothetical protein